MGNIGLYGAVHLEICSKGNGKGVVINWVSCPKFCNANGNDKVSFALFCSQYERAFRVKTLFTKKNIRYLVNKRKDISFQNFRRVANQGNSSAFSILF